MKKIILSASLLALLIMPAIAQEAIQTDPSERSGLASQGSSIDKVYSVDMYTGSMGVNIPIFDYSVDGLSLGVSIGYDARGIKLDQRATSLGLGWDLSAGGSIEREVFGIEDEGVRTDDPNDPNAPLHVGNWVGHFNSDNGGEDTKDDAKYDLFKANFAGRSVEFMMEWDVTQTVLVPRVFPKSELKIEVKIERQAGYLPWTPWTTQSDLKPMAFRYYRMNLNDNHVTFIIADEQGNKFYFGRGEFYNELHSLNGILIPYRATKKWVLNKIETYTGNVILYEYDSEEVYDVPIAVSESVTERNWSNSNSAGSDGELRRNSEIIKYTGVSKILRKIKYPNGTEVELFYSQDSRCDMDGARALISINMKQRYAQNNENILGFKFEYAYFRTPTPGNSSTEVPFSAQGGCGLFGYANDEERECGLRLKLKSIRHTGTNGVTDEPYFSFDYHSQHLGLRLSPSKDFYGYYNGKPSVSVCKDAYGNPCLWPYETLFLNSSVVRHMAPQVRYTTGFPPLTNTHYATLEYGVDRTPDFDKRKGWLLEGLTNGAGGKTQFYYKDHQISTPTGSYGTYNISGQHGDNATDGVAIDYITYKDGYSDNNSYKRTYTFSEGHRFYKGGFYWYWYDSSASIKNTVYTNEFVDYHSYFNGSNHGYTYAEVATYGAGNPIMLLNKNRYVFSNIIDFQNSVSNMKWDGGPFDGYETFQTPYYFQKYRMGLLREVESYDHANTLVKKQTFQYIASLPPAVSLNSPIVSYLSRSQSGKAPPSPNYYHSFVNNLMLPSKMQITEYFPSGQHLLEKDYYYDINDNIICEKWKDSKQTLFKKYNLFSTISATVPQFDLATTTWKFLPNSDSILIDGSATVLETIGFLPHMRFTHVAKLKVSEPLTSSVVGGGTAAFFGAATNWPLTSQQLRDAVVVERQHTLFDNGGNVIETRLNETEVYRTQLWDTRIGKRLAIIDNARFDDVAYTSFEGEFASPTQGQTDFNRGNWVFSSSDITYVSPLSPMHRSITGRYYYHGSNPIQSRLSPQAGKKLKITLWSTQAPNVQVGSLPITMSQVVQYGDWKLYTGAFTGNGQPLTIYPGSGTSMIDELRLFPERATITTWCYDPLLGINTVSDERNNISYQEYDVFGRPCTIKDIQGNVLSHTQLVTQGTDN